MRRAINTSARLFAESFEPRGPVIEIGSYYVTGYEKLSNLRPYFPGREYVGCDIRPGNGVDRIEDAHSLSFADASIGTVLMFETLEHLPAPRRAVDEAMRVLRDDGIIAVSVPFSFYLHGFPTDYWRFTASGVHALLGRFPHKVVFALGPRLKPAFVFGVGGKAGTSNWARGEKRFRQLVADEFATKRFRAHLSVLRERGRDFVAALIGRAELQAAFFDPSQAGGFLDVAPPPPKGNAGL